jgi:hypothetical protein
MFDSASSKFSGFNTHFCKEQYSQTQRKHKKALSEHPYQWQWTLHSRRRPNHDQGTEANQEGATPLATLLFWTYTHTIGQTIHPSVFHPLIQEIVYMEGGSDCKTPLRALHLH